MLSFGSVVGHVTVQYKGAVEQELKMKNCSRNADAKLVVVVNDPWKSSGCDVYHWDVVMIISG